MTSITCDECGKVIEGLSGIPTQERSVRLKLRGEVTFELKVKKENADICWPCAKMLLVKVFSSIQ